MRTEHKEVYCCEYCDKEFDDAYLCEQHEKTHITDYSKKSTKEIRDDLALLESVASAYRIGNMVMGMPIKSFHSLINETIERLGKSE